jgi:2'-deoxycytidine 5'-triphosphate deaminase (DCD), C-terminal domain
MRSHEVPFLIEDGQTLGRLVYERLIGRPDKLYGRAALSVRLIRAKGWRCRNILSNSPAPEPEFHHPFPRRRFPSR